MASSTSRLALSYPSGTDAESSFVALDQGDMTTLDTAVLTSQGTLAARPAATSVPTGYLYCCTDVGVMFVTVTLSGTNTWLPIPVVGGTTPVGGVMDFAGSSVPADADGVQRWHVCDGSLVGRTAYPALFSAIGTAYNAGDGSTTFGLPDLRGRVTVGAGAGPGLTTKALAATGGEESHTLVAAESGVNGNGTTSNETTLHAHESLDVGFLIQSSTGIGVGAFGLPYDTTGNLIAGLASSVAGDTQGLPFTISNLTHTENVDHLHDLNARTADAAHNNLQPFSVANKIIRIQ